MIQALHHGLRQRPIRMPRRSLYVARITAGAFALSAPAYLDSKKLSQTSDVSSTAGTANQSHRTPKCTEDFLSANDGRLDSRLNAYALTTSPGGSSGIWRYDVAQLACANPSEDDHVEAVLPVPTGSWSFFAVLDGHSGWETSAWLRDNLIMAAAGALADLYQSFTRSNSAEQPRPSPVDIEKTLKETFLRLDDDIVHQSLEQVFQSRSPRADGINLLAPAYAGSCALLSFYESQSRLLHVAVTGDSRAVVGRKEVSSTGEVTYRVHVLSVDQTGNSSAEKARLSAAHPDEEVVKNGRVLGMGISRAFGDARYKWSLATQAKLKAAYMGRTPLRNVKTPPYLTAEPEVSTIKIQPGDFLILATDGLWEALSNEDAVGLVGWWKDSRVATGTTGNPAQLPVDQQSSLAETTRSNSGSERHGQWGVQKAFVKRDENVGTHLIRNAIGGADEDLVTSILSMRPPRARSYIDDITVTVVFFDEQ